MAHHGDDAWGIIGVPRIIRAAKGDCRVFEFISPFYTPRQRALVFHCESTDEMLRLLEYPRDWQFLGDDELLVLMKGAPPL